MKTIDLHIVDIVHNSLRAEAKKVVILFVNSDKENQIAFSVEDDGKGISKENLNKIKSDFFTSRKERSIGMGLSLLDFHTHQTGGELVIKSKENQGTYIKAIFIKNHVDRQPIGDLAACISEFVCQFSDVDFRFVYKSDAESFELSTKQLEDSFEGIDMNQLEVINLVRQYISDNT